MPDKESQIDVEKIVDDIKKDIASNYSPEEIAAFEPVEFESSLTFITPKNVYNSIFLEDKLITAYHETNVEWDRPVSGHGFKSTIMEVVKRFTRFFIAPIVEDQNRFNNDVADVVYQLKLLVDEQSKRIEELESQIKTLKDQA